MPIGRGGDCIGYVSGSTRRKDIGGRCDTVRFAEWVRDDGPAPPGTRVGRRAMFVSFASVMGIVRVHSVPGREVGFGWTVIWSG